MTDLYPVLSAKRGRAAPTAMILLLLAVMTAACPFLAFGATAARPAPPPPIVTATVTVPPEVLLAQPDPPPGIEEMLKRDEGRSLKLYRDTDRNWSIGYGRNITARGISESEALFMLQNDIKACQLELDSNLKWWRLLNTQRQLAMLSLCYNLGIYGLLEFKASLAAMEAGRYKDAARLFLHSRWAKQVGHRAGRITALIDPERNKGAGPDRAAPAPPKRRSARQRAR